VLKQVMTIVKKLNTKQQKLGEPVTSFQSLVMKASNEFKRLNKAAEEE